MHFTKYGIGDFNDLLSEENFLTESDTYNTALDKIEADGLNYVGMSHCADSIIEMLINEPELDRPTHLIEVEGEELHFYIATY